jgi:hypothetical protein
MSHHFGARLEQLRKTTKPLNEYMRLMERNQLWQLQNINQRCTDSERKFRYLFVRNSRHPQIMSLSAVYFVTCVPPNNNHSTQNLPYSYFYLYPTRFGRDWPSLERTFQYNSRYLQNCYILSVNWSDHVCIVTKHNLRNQVYNKSAQNM